MPRREKGSSPPCKWVASLIMRAEYMHLYTCFFSLPYETWGCIESPRGGATKCSLAMQLLSATLPLPFSFIWRWRTDRFLRDVLRGVNEWVSKEEHGEGRKGAAGKSLGYSIYALPHGRETPASPALQVPSLSPSPTLSGVFWPYLSIPDPNPALLPCRGSCSEISKSCK